MPFEKTDSPGDRRAEKEREERRKEKQTERRYTVMEIAAAAKMNRSTIRSRRVSLGIPGNRKGYTLEEVKKIIQPPKKKRNNYFNQAKADELKRTLQNDGYIPY